MESRREDNPWRRKGRIEFVAFTDIVIAVLGIAYASHRMFTFYWHWPLPNADFVDTPKSKDTDDNAFHLPFFLFTWAVVELFYIFQVGASCVLYGAINQEAMESDPYISLQKCRCWLRCSRVIFGVTVIKLCLQPVIIFVGKFTNIATIGLLLCELLFRFVAMLAVNKFMQDLQQ